MSRTTARRQRGVHRARDYDPEFGDADDDARKYRKSFVGRSRRARRLLRKFPALARVVDRLSTRTGALGVVMVLMLVLAASRSGSRARRSSMSSSSSSSFGQVEDLSSRGGRAPSSVSRDIDGGAPVVRSSNGVTQGSHRRTGVRSASGSKLIPRIIHQTYKSRKALTERDRAMMQTWSDMNPDWETRFYEDEDCAAFVNEHFPEYFEAYSGLTKKVEQSDFFRYLVILKHGGVYADIDTECRQPLDEVIDAQDTLIVGWENEFRTDAQAYSRHFVRRRQVLNWAFAGAPGHPALVAVSEHIKAGAKTVFTKASNRNTLEKTGPGAFTDALMKHFESQRTDGKTFWNVRMLPKVAFGTHPLGEEGVSQEHPDVVIAHRYSGGWKHKSGWNGKRSIFDHMSIFYHSLKNDLPEYREKIASRDEHFQMPPVENGRMYPVSTIWEPSFDLMTPLVGTVMDKEREAEGYWMTMYGRPRLATQKPLPSGQTPADILFSGLERHAGQHVPERGVFVDIGAGLGYYTNAAASHGQDVYAYEWYREHGINLRAAVDYNGYASNVKIDTDFAVSRAEHMFDALFSQVSKIDAMRIAGRGYDVEILRGANLLFAGEKRPDVLLLELNVHVIGEVSSHSTKDITQSIEYLWNQGYTDVGHVGPACDGRGVRTVKSLGAARRKSAFESTVWCRLDLNSLKGVLSAMHDDEPETIVLFNTAQHD